MPIMTIEKCETKENWHWFSMPIISENVKRKKKFVAFRIAAIILKSVDKS